MSYVYLTIGWWAATLVMWRVASLATVRSVAKPELV